MEGLLMERLGRIAARVACIVFFIIVLIELAVRFRGELSPVWEHILGPTILHG